MRAALRREADRRGLFLSDELMDYLLVRFARDLGSLMGLLDRLDRYALEASARSPCRCCARCWRPKRQAPQS